MALGTLSFVDPGSPVLRTVCSLGNLVMVDGVSRCRHWPSPWGAAPSGSSPAGEGDADLYPLRAASYTVTAGMAHSFHLEGGQCTLMSNSVDASASAISP
jgi:hypothetical protein